MAVNNPDRLVPAKYLRLSVYNLHRLIGKTSVENIFTRLNQLKIDLGNDADSYFISDIRFAFDRFFGKEASELLIQVIERELAKQNINHAAA